jgi:hypothetical protein
MLYRKQTSIEFHKNKIREEHFFEEKKTEQIIPMSESCSSTPVTLQQEEELYVEKKMKSKMTNLFFYQYRYSRNVNGRVTKN